MRQRAIARTTPALLGLFSWTTLAAHYHPAYRRLVRQAVADLRGRHRPSATPPVAGAGRFLTVGRQLRHAAIPRRSVSPNGGSPRLRRLNCGKPSLELARCAGSIETYENALSEVQCGRAMSAVVNLVGKWPAKQRKRPLSEPLLSRKSGNWCRGADSNHRHRHFQCRALPG